MHESPAVNEPFPTALFFDTRAADWQAAWDIGKTPLPSAGIRDIPNAVLLPLRRKVTQDSLHFYYEGGLCDESGSFVACRRRSLSDDWANLSMLWPYPVQPDEIEERDEDVVFGGVIFSHWGHLITDSTARLWYAVSHPEDTRKLVFLERPGQKAQWASADWRPLFGMAGIDPARVEIVTRPTRFRQATVPDEAYYPFSGFRPEWTSFFDAVRKRVSPSPHRKIYFSRTRCGRNDTFNEDLFEDYYREQGFHIVHPEDCSLEEEVACAAGADQIVGTIGTLSHNFLFCNPGTEATVLLRSSSLVNPQLLIGAACGLRCSYVQVAINVLPAHHSNCVYYLAPTDHFAAHLEAAGLPPFGDDRSKAACSPERIRPYVRQWLETFTAKPAVFANAASSDATARAGFAEAFRAESNPSVREKIADGISSFAGVEIRLRHRNGELKLALKRKIEKHKAAIEKHKATIEKFKETTTKLKQETRELKGMVKQLKRNVPPPRKPFDLLWPLRLLWWDYRRRRRNQAPLSGNNETKFHEINC